jgi:hypothetical protein
VRETKDEEENTATEVKLKNKKVRGSRKIDVFVGYSCRRVPTEKRASTLRVRKTLSVSRQ